MTLDLSKKLGALLIEKGFTISTAESCTAGAIGAAIASVDGSSAYFIGGIISYATELKVKLLGVNPNVIKGYGVVSRQTALEMNVGARIALKTDLAISITGYAGASGGDEFAENGTIWICVGSNEKSPQTLCLHVNGERRDNLAYAVEQALQLAIDYLSC